MHLNEKNIYILRQLDGVFLVKLNDHGDKYLYSPLDIAGVINLEDLDVNNLPEDVTLVASAQTSVHWTGIGEYLVSIQFLECFSTDVDRSCDESILRVSMPYLKVTESNTAYTIDQKFKLEGGSAEIYSLAVETFDKYTAGITERDGLEYMAEDSPFEGKTILVEDLCKLYGRNTVLLHYPADFREQEHDVKLFKELVAGEAMVDIYNPDSTVNQHCKVAGVRLLSSAPGPLGGESRLAEVLFEDTPIIPANSMVTFGIIKDNGNFKAVGTYIELPNSESPLAAAIKVFESLTGH